MRKLTATQIKVIAIIAMTIDHIGYMLIPAGTTTYYILVSPQAINIQQNIDKSELM